MYRFRTFEPGALLRNVPDRLLQEHMLLYFDYSFPEQLDPFFFSSFAISEYSCRAAVGMILIKFYMRFK